MPTTVVLTPNDKFTSQRARQTGFTSKAIQFSLQGKHTHDRSLINRGMKGDLQMKKLLLAILAGIGLVAVSLVLIKTRPIAAQTRQSAAVFDSEGRLQAPDPTVFRKWVFVGAPLTPNALNNGKANFPEYHHVYI